MNLRRDVPQFLPFAKPRQSLLQLGASNASAGTVIVPTPQLRSPNLQPHRAQVPAQRCFTTARPCRARRTSLVTSTHVSARQGDPVEGGSWPRSTRPSRCPAVIDAILPIRRVRSLQLALPPHANFLGHPQRRLVPLSNHADQAGQAEHIESVVSHAASVA